MKSALLDAMLNAPDLPELNGEYPPVFPQSDGLLGSDVVPGFEIPLRALFDEEENALVMKRIWSAPG